MATERGPLGPLVHDSLDVTTISSAYFPAFSSSLPAVLRRIILVEIKCQLDATDDIYCRLYCMLNMFRAILCPSSGAREYCTDGRAPDDGCSIARNMLRIQ